MSKFPAISVAALGLAFAAAGVATGAITEIIDSSGDGVTPLIQPSGVAIDGSHSVFLSANNGKVFKITTTGEITLAHTLPAGGVRIRFDADGALYSIGSPSSVYKITPSGTISTIIDSSGDGAGNPLSVPDSIAVDGDGNVLVTGRLSNNAFKITPAGTITEIIDSSSSLASPRGIAADSSGNVFVAGEDSDSVFKITPSGTITEIIDATGDGAGNSFLAPYGVATDASGNVYAAGSSSNNLFVITPAGTITELIDSTGDGAGNGLNLPIFVSAHANGTVFVAGWFSDNVFRISPSGTIVEIIDGFGASGPGNWLDSPGDIAIHDPQLVIVSGVGSDNAFRVGDSIDCGDFWDNDGDGLADFPADPGCDSLEDASELNPAVACDDGADNDGDGSIDFPDDPGCNDPVDASELNLAVGCDDGSDNDGDGSIDFPADPGCADSADSSELNPAAPCDDGIDNDADGHTDYPDDPGCGSLEWSTEKPECDDNIDNDGDGKKDWDGAGVGLADPECDGRGFIDSELPGPTGRFEGTLTFSLGALPPMTLTGVGVSTIDGPGGLASLAIRLDNGISGQAAVPVTDPEATATIVSFRLSAAVGGGTLAPIQLGGALTQNVLPLPGALRICLAFTGCGSYLPLILTESNASYGFGIGGLVTVGGLGPVRFSAQVAPWALGPATLTTQTANGAFVTRMDQGFIHTPASDTLSVLSPSAAVRLVSPVQVMTKGIGGNHEKMALFTSLTLRFVPEPAMLLLLSSGALVLVLLGRWRGRSGASW